MLCTVNYECRTAYCAVYYDRRTVYDGRCAVYHERQRTLFCVLRALHCALRALYCVLRALHRALRTCAPQNTSGGPPIVPPDLASKTGVARYKVIVGGCQSDPRDATAGRSQANTSPTLWVETGRIWPKDTNRSGAPTSACGAQQAEAQHKGQAACAVAFWKELGSGGSKFGCPAC